MGQRLVRDKTKTGQLLSIEDNQTDIQEKLLEDCSASGSNSGSGSGNSGSVVITIRMLKMEQKCHKCNNDNNELVNDNLIGCSCQQTTTTATGNYHDFIRNRLLSSSSNNNNMMTVTSSTTPLETSSTSTLSSNCDNNKIKLNITNNNNNQINNDIEQSNNNHIPDKNIKLKINNNNNNQLDNNLNIKNLENNLNNINKLGKLNIIDDDSNNSVATTSSTLTSSSPPLMYNGNNFGNVCGKEVEDAVIIKNNNSNNKIININRTSDCLNIHEKMSDIGLSKNVTPSVTVATGNFIETGKCDTIEVSSQNGTTCNNCKRKTLTSLGTSKRLRGCKLCRSSTTTNSINNKELQTVTSTINAAGPTTSKETGKSKKGNWSLKLNCAKLKGSKSSSSSSSSSSTSNSSSNSSINVNNGDKTDPCVCTSFRKKLDNQDSPTDNLLQTSSSSSLLQTSTANQVEQLFPATTAALLLQSSNNNIEHHQSSSSGSSPLLQQQQQQPTLIHSNGQLIQRTATAFYSSLSNSTGGGNLIVLSMNQAQPLLDFTRFNPEEFPIEDCDERARIQRAVEIAEGVEPPPGFRPRNPQIQQHQNQQQQQQPQQLGTNTNATTPHWHMLCTPDAALHNFLQSGFILQNSSIFNSTEQLPRIHSQVDYIHCLVPDLQKITSCSFYWGKMDRYEAERLLEGKPEGTFLLRDSAQEEYLFSVSFRKYGRSLHARIEQFNHKFSFDSHDPGVYTATSVTGLLEHYKDPACVMFFEPMLTIPLNRNFTFSLQQLCRATIVSNTTYDKINEFSLPKALKSYLKEYHYKQRVRVKRFDEHTYVNS